MKINVIKIICIAENFDTTFHTSFLKITFVNSHLKNTNSKGDFVLKNRFETSVLKISGIQK